MTQNLLAIENAIQGAMRVVTPTKAYVSREMIRHAIIENHIDATEGDIKLVLQKLYNEGKIRTYNGVFYRC